MSGPGVQDTPSVRDTAERYRQLALQKTVCLGGNNVHPVCFILFLFNSGGKLNG